MHLCICIPSYDNSIMAVTALSLFTSLGALTQAGHTFTMHFFLGDSLLARARSVLAAKVLDSKDVDALVFVDTDLQFDDKTLVRLVEAVRNTGQMAALAYPVKTIRDGLEQHIREGMDFATAFSRTADYAFGKVIAPDVEGLPGFSEVEEIGLGLAVIPRGILEAIAATVPKASSGGKYAKPEETAVFSCIFESELSDEDPKRYLGEDYSFCRRVRGVGRKVLALCDAQVVHVGSFYYAGKARDSQFFARMSGY